MFIPFVSIFENARSNTPDKVLYLSGHILSTFKNGTYKSEVEAIRACTDKKQRDELKKQLPAVTWSGTFDKRNSKGITAYSYLICHDIDNLDHDSLATLKKALSLDPRVYAVFISPSGNGLKVLFRLEQGDHPLEHISNFHEAAWLAIGNYLHRTYEITIDEKCKDICRLCFVSYDPELYVDEFAMFTNDLITKYGEVSQRITAHNTKEKKFRQAAPKTSDRLQALLSKCHEITQKTQQAAPGSYNAYINVFAIQANRYAIAESDCLNELLYHCAEHDTRDTTAVVKNVYKRFSTEHGQWIQESNRMPAVKIKASVPAPLQVAAAKLPDVDDTVKFWYEVEKIDAKGNVKGKEYKFSYNSGIKFLANNGFFKYRIDKNNFQLIKVNLSHKIVDIVSELHVKEFYFDYLSDREDEDEYWHVLEMMRRGIKNYCSTSVLEGLPYYMPQLKRDCANTAYVYFRNCFVVITRNNTVIKNYEEQDGFVWQKQIIDADYRNLVGWQTQSVFERYIQYAICGRKCNLADLTEQEQKKISSVRTSIGYMIHQYKNPAQAKAVISVDKKERSLGEANGRSGKSLLAKGLARMINQCYIDGPRFKFDYDFAFQDVSSDTQFINFNDVPKNFPFDRLFGMITEEFTYNKKKLDGIVIPFALSPKFYISTNYSLKGDGESNKGRQQIIEFSDYFNSKHTPANEFGHMFFDEWDADEWCRFYNYMIGCVELYMQNGLIEFPLENYGLNKLLDTAGEEFVDFMHEQVFELRSIATAIEYKPLFEAYISHAKHHGNIKSNTFKKWMTMWAAVNGLEINAHKNGERDKRNNVDYVTFTLSGDYKPEVKDDPGAEPEKLETLPF